MLKKHHFLILITFIGGVIGFIVVHHGAIHNGEFSQGEDFDSAIFYLTKSHEGIIIIITLITVGVIIGHYKWFQK